MTSPTPALAGQPLVTRESALAAIDYLDLSNSGRRARDARGMLVEAQPAAPEMSGDFPPRILALLLEVADRKGTGTHGPWEDGNGEPLQDDAHTALRWIVARAAAAAPAEAEVYLCSRPSGVKWPLMVKDMSPETKAMFEAEGTKLTPMVPAATASAGHSVAVPTSEEQAALMVLLGTQWLEQHAPQRLKAAAPAGGVTREQAITRAMIACGRGHEGADHYTLIHKGGTVTLSGDDLARTWNAALQAARAAEPETMTLQEVWEAAGGNPGIKPSRQDVLDALKVLDQVCDEADAARAAELEGFYVASRASIPERPAMWQGLRLKGWPITSTWIDEAGEGETDDMGELWRRIHDEIQRSTGVLLYAEADDFPLKGALIECGIALGMGKPVAVVMPDVRLHPRSMKPLGSWAAHPLVTRYDTLEAARQALAASPTPPAAAGVAVPAMECHGLDTPERVCFYEQDFYVLSNFSSFRVTFDGQTFDTSEAAYHYQRFLRPEDRRGVMYAMSAHDAFRYAQAHKHHQRADWDVVKVGVMREILRAKARQHEYVRRKLLATGERELVENSWRDSFWGWGPNQDGQNMLGKLWMEVRAELVAAGLGASA